MTPAFRLCVNFYYKENDMTPLFCLNVDSELDDFGGGFSLLM